MVRVAVAEVAQHVVPVPDFPAPDFPPFETIPWSGWT